MNLEAFDEEIGNMLNRGNNRAAIEEAKKVAAHAVVAAAGIYIRLADKDSALKLMKLAVEMQPDNPVYYSNIVCLLSQMNRDDEAETYSRKGITLPGADADMFFNHGLVCKNLHCKNLPSSNELLLEAASAFRKSCELAPESAWTYCVLANILLPLGFYEEGLRADEWRFKCMPLSQWRRTRYKKPFWDGKADLHNKKILVINEQGHGDGIQYSRYIFKLKEAGAYVILEVKPEIRSLYTDAPYADYLVDFKENGPFDFPEHDFIVSVASLPYFFDANLDNIPMEIPYLYPCEKSMPEIDSLINDKKFKLGIIWAGHFYHSSDKERTCCLRQFEPLFNIPGLTVFSLQKGNMIRSWRLGETMSLGDEDYEVVDLLKGSEHLKYVDLAAHIENFNETALVLRKLDLLISVDTSTAHLAGALGLPVWMLLPNAHEWRWKKKWYPSMRIFKQPVVGDWKGLLENVAVELQKHIAIQSGQ